MACIEEERKKAFVVFASTYEAAKYLSLEQKGELFEKLGAYSLEGKEVHSNNPMIDVILKMTIPNMDAAERRHQTAIENGAKSKGKDFPNIGRPRKGETREEYDARRLERARMLEAGAENPQKPLNKDINTNTDRDIDINKEIDIERYKDTDVKKEIDINKNIDIKKNTNIGVITNSVYTNQVSFSNSLNPVLGNTKEDEIPSQGEAQSHVSSFNSKIEEDYSKYEERPRQEEMRGSNGADFLSSITLDDDYATPSTPPDERYRNYVGNIQDIIRLGSYDYDDMTDEEMADAIEEDVNSAIEQYMRCGRSQRFQDLVERAKQTYMRLYGCSEAEAKSGITRLYQQRKKVMNNDYNG